MMTPVNRTSDHVFDETDPLQAELRDGLKTLSDHELSQLEGEMLWYVDEGICSRAITLFLQLTGGDTPGMITS